MPRPSRNDTHPALMNHHASSAEPSSVDVAGKVDKDGMPWGWSTFPEKARLFMVMRPFAGNDAEVLTQLGYGKGSLKTILQKWRQDKRLRDALKLIKDGYRLPVATLSRELRRKSQDDLIPMLEDNGKEASEYIEVIKILFQTKAMHRQKDRVGSLALTRLMFIQHSPEYMSDPKLRVDVAKLIERISDLLEPDKEEQDRERHSAERNYLSRDMIKRFGPPPPPAEIQRNGAASHN